MGLNSLWFDGVNLSERFGCIIASESVWNSPARDVDAYTIPGRNGTVLVDNGRFENIDIEYNCYCDKQDSTRADELRAFLSSRKGYCRLEDGYHPNEYRFACFRSGTDFDINGKVKLKFDCKPQRYIESSPVYVTGGTTITVDKSSALLEYDALPQGAKTYVFRAFGSDAYTMRFKVVPVSTSKPITIRTLGDWAICTYAPNRVYAYDYYKGNGDKVINNTFGYSSVYIDENATFTLLSGSETKFARSINTANAENPTYFDAHPLIEVTVNGAHDGIIATVDGSAITGKWTANDVDGISFFVIDCETLNAYVPPYNGMNAINMNKFVNIPSEFVLKPGANVIGAGLDLKIDRGLYTI